jgi:hypothetical protein
MSAIFSPCGRYRMRLERDLGGKGPTAAIFGVNPSTADAVANDHTIRKDLGFAQLLGWGRIIKGNKFAYRSTDIKGLATVADPVGPDNDAHLEQIMRDADIHVVAWGSLGKLPPGLRERWKVLARIADGIGCQLLCWGTCQDGQPVHPLRISYDLQLKPWARP